MKPGEATRLYSRMFDTEQEARDYALQVRADGYESLVMRAERQPENSDEVHFYQWKLVNDGASWKYRLGIFLTSPKFVIPFVIGIVAYVLLKRNNGLPRVIG
jgi:hypothetical protein